ncbi:hypothetical protein SCHPADRAFT_851595 [Schizopora paradoxa]|uniref:Uncharacterized protein n=1 Tax=Schizopora paradoxa TaxID=27342 RepID=A0A0H2SB72_9AGAM|nr:hypothetical protein SCHPADRAFT_851595 [Schizopora paradoxa]
MPPKQYLPTHELYADQLLPLNLGLALYEPDPGPGKEEVRVGDIGFIYDGRFKRIASVFETGNGIPVALEERFQETEPFTDLDKGVLSSKHVRSEGFEGDLHGCEPMTGSSAGLSFKLSCHSNSGATLIRKYRATVEKASFPIKLKHHFGKHFRTVYDFAKENGMVENLHDIILVHGRVMTGDWATMAFSNQSEDNCASFDMKAATVTAKGTLWGKWSDDIKFPRRHGPLRKHAFPDGQEPNFNQCVFIETCRFYDLPWFHRLTATLRIAQNKGSAAKTDISQASRKVESTSQCAGLLPPEMSVSEGQKVDDDCREMLTAYDVLAFRAFLAAFERDDEQHTKESLTKFGFICIDEEDVKRLLPRSGTLASMLGHLKNKQELSVEPFDVTALDSDGSDEGSLSNPTCMEMFMRRTPL